MTSRLATSQLSAAASVLHASEADRAKVLRQLGADGPVVEELLEYNASPYAASAASAPDVAPDAAPDAASDAAPDAGAQGDGAASGEGPNDERFVEAWTRYADEADRRSIPVFNVLRERLPQLQFPIQEGISDTAAYRAATRKGQLPDAASGLSLDTPEALELRIHPSAAGHIPVLIPGSRADFVRLVQALTRKNEPDDIPNSMGACLVSGYNNWDRIATYRRNWLDQPGTSSLGWSAEFRRLIPQKERYQDRFILLSRGAYSGVTARELGVDAEEWRKVSLRIRLEHEAAHYVTIRNYGAMHTNALDELMADFAGLTAAVGVFKADWFRRFMGLEDDGAYRTGGRLENYCRGVSAPAQRVLERLVRRSTHHLDAFSAQNPACTGTASVPLLAAGTLEMFAHETAVERLCTAWNRIATIADNGWSNSPIG